jgi:hypothetical protein
MSPENREEGSMQANKLGVGMRLGAAVLLAVALLLPLDSLPTLDGRRTYSYAWQVARDDWGSGGLLALAFLWPVIVAVLHGRGAARYRPIVATLAEPALAVFSAILIVVNYRTTWAWQPIVPWFPVLGGPVTGSAAAGSWLGLTADALYMVGWIVSGWSLRPFRRRPGAALPGQSCPVS